MAVTILSESYGPRKPFVVCTAASTDELAAYVGLWAEGSEATISATKYVLDKTNGWVLPGQSGKELPAVTADDNGDVLTVVDGAWGKAAPSGGGGGSGALVVTCTYSDKIITADKTTKEIYDAYVAGTVVLFANANAFGDTTYDSVLGAIDLGDGSYRMTVSADFLYFSGSANEYPICDTSDD